MFIACFILCVASIWSFKMTFVFYYSDLYNRAVTIRKHALYFTAVFALVSFVLVLELALLECRPLSLARTNRVPSGVWLMAVTNQG
jgi:hypothetical protein